MEFNRFKLNLDFTYHNNQIHLTANGQTKAKKKKITGSRLGAVLGVNEYQSPFQVWCDLLGFYSSEGERYFLEAGSIIEPKLNAYVQKQLQLKFKSYHSPAVGYDLFPNNPIFGGVPDGEPLGENNQLVFDHKHYLLEIKTASLDEYE